MQKKDSKLLGFQGQHLEYRDRQVRGYGQFIGERDLLLTVPHTVKVTDFKWISLWCRQFGVNFGEAFFY